MRFKVCGFKSITGLILLLLFTCSVSEITLAATDGKADYSSTGTAEISVIIPELIQVTGAEDIDISYNSNSRPSDIIKQICVYSNTGGGTFMVTAQGSGKDRAFDLLANDGKDVKYRIVAKAPLNGSGRSNLKPLDESLHKSVDRSASFDCSSSDKSNFELMVLSRLSQQKTSAVINGTLTLVVEPN